MFYKIDLNDLTLADSLYVGGIPIQGNYLSLSSIQTTTPTVPFAANNDTAASAGEEITIDVLANDTGDNLVLAAVDPAQHGQVSIVNGKLDYTPTQGFSGTETIWYGVTSGTEWRWAAVTITVTSNVQPDPLKANKDTVTTTADTAVTIDVLANDTGTGLTIGWYDDPGNGTLTVVNNKFLYTPNAGFVGTEDFWYEVVDATGQTSWGNVVVTVGNGGGSTTLVANDDVATVSLNESVTIDVLANDAGVDLVLADVDDTWTGSAEIVNNKIKYTAGNEAASLELWYGVTDSSGNEEWAKVTITIE